MATSARSPIDSISLNHGSLRDNVADTLRTAIFDGTLKPGDSIRERHLANRLQVSQATVREALMHLESTGLVVRMKNRGTMVTRLTRRQAEERIGLRKKLEAWALIEAAQCMTDEGFHGLERRFAELAKATRENSYVATTQGDMEFHRYIWRWSGNQVLYDVLDRVSAPLFAFVSFLNRDSFLNQDSPAIRRLVIDEHEKIIQAMHRKDAVEISEVISRHIDLGYERGEVAQFTYGYE